MPTQYGLRATVITWSFKMCVDAADQKAISIPLSMRVKMALKQLRGCVSILDAMAV
jgi:hypothetical protein